VKPKIKQTLSVSVSIADVLLQGIDAAAAEKLQAALKEAGVPDGVPVEVTVTPRKYDYEAVATW
jgi:hypothetical protein